MALLPPPNALHIPLPPDPSNPATLMDIAAARIYSDRLVASKCESLTTASGINLKLLMPLIPVAGIPNGAVDENIGAAEAYKAGVIFDHNPGGNVAPPWLAELTATIAEMAATVEANTATLQQVVTDLDMVIF